MELDESEFPDNYEIMSKIKSPLSVLKYNLTFLFSDNYPAKMNPDFARDMILMYSKENQIVWDGCCGSGTVPIIASRLIRFGVGSDINPKAVSLAREHAEKETGKYVTLFKVGDARSEDITNLTGAKVDLILSSLPFGLNIAGDKNHYSGEEFDLSNSETYQRFFEQVELVIKNYFDNLRGGGILILDARDRTKEGKLYDLINYFRDSAKRVGFDLIGRYYFEMIPYRTMTYKHRETKYVMPMVDAMDVIVLYKPENERLI